MNKQNDPNRIDKMPTGSPTRTGAIRRFFNAWRSWAELMDYSAFDYSLDRIGQLEARVEELERAQNATDDLPPQVVVGTGVSYSRAFEHW